MLSRSGAYSTSKLRLRFTRELLPRLSCTENVSVNEVPRVAEDGIVYVQFRPLTLKPLVTAPNVYGAAPPDAISRPRIVSPGCPPESPVEPRVIGAKSTMYVSERLTRVPLLSLTENDRLKVRPRIASLEMLYVHAPVLLLISTPEDEDEYV